MISPCSKKLHSYSLAVHDDIDVLAVGVGFVIKDDVVVRDCPGSRTLCDLDDRTAAGVWRGKDADRVLVVVRYWCRTPDSVVVLCVNSSLDRFQSGHRDHLLCRRGCCRSQGKKC